MNPVYSAYVPCCNNVATLRAAVESVRGQIPAPDEVIVVDDGSTDDPGAVLAGLEVRLVRHDRTLGRGAARARAMQEARHELVLCCDATMTLEPAFAARALPWFADAAVAAVYGHITQRALDGVAARWRGRHLFKIPYQAAVALHQAALMTGGMVLRKSAASAVGGFNPAQAHGEDADLGRRLLAHGFDVVSDPALVIVAIGRNSVAKVLERYWRWNGGDAGPVTWRGYRANVGYACSMMAADWRARDLAACAMSAFCPHYCFWRSWWSRSRRRKKPGAPS